ncbi:MAG: Ig-like domain-containing protein, partial [Bacteroidales bacterium]|nr:Ig-like domain-containing protein [Bacteroidales bacterium]
MRKSFTRLFGVFILLCMMSLQVVAQSTSTFGYSLSPTDGKYPVSVTQGDFVITMNTPVKAVYDGTISLNNYNGTEYVPCQLRPGYETAAGSGIFVAPAGSENAWRVEFSGNKVIINFDYDLGEFQNYYITVSESAIQNASGTLRFVGLKAGSIALTSGNDAGYDWDFTTEDLTPPTPVWSAFNAVAPKTDPTDEEVNVSPSLTTFTLEFSEDVKFKSGITSAANLSVGDIALYESTDVGVYGGDVVYATPSAISISGKVLSITWPGVLPSMAKLYVRIKPGIITDLQGLAFAGFNTNGVGANIGWNFSTKDARVPNVTFAAVTPCNTTNFTANTNFTITLDEIGIVLGNGNRTPITAANIKSYIQFSGGDFSVTSVAEVAGSTVITIDPAAALTSGTVYTISLTAGLWDSGDNAIPAKLSQNLVAGDYTAPTTDILAWKNPDGTSFNINLRVNNEPAGTTTRYYYIVVKASDVATSANADYYKPESLTNLLAAANTTAAFPTDVKTSISTTVPTTYAYYPWVGSTTVTTDDRYIPIFQRGDIFAPANTELLEHVVQLPASHGTDWVVYLFGADGSLCGSNTVTGLFSATANVTTIQKLTPSTFDILVPEVTFSAELVDAVHDTIDGCSEKLQVIAGDDNIAKGIKRNGPVYIHFNEAIETNMGAAITGAHIASSVTLIDNASNTYTIDAARSSYDAANKKMIIYPTTPFASGVQLTVTLLSNKIQDAQDLERFG